VTFVSATVTRVAVSTRVLAAYGYGVSIGLSVTKRAGKRYGHPYPELN